MHVVAITRLGTAVEDEAKLLAADLSTVPYQLRLRLNGGMPAIVLTTADEAQAHALRDRLCARGHDAMCVALSEVVATKDMLAPLRFQLDADALVAVEHPAGRLAWHDVSLLVQAMHRSSTTVVRTVRRKQPLSPLRVRHQTLKSETSLNESDEGVLYIFPRSGRPWSLRQLRARFDALGDDETLSATRNFALVVEKIRMHARQATFDDRLLRRKGTVAETDLLAHLIAHAPATAESSPFR